VMARPKVLLRDDKDRKPRGKGWLPNERRPGTSKHLASTHQKDIMKTKYGEDGEQVDELGERTNNLVLCLQSRHERVLLRGRGRQDSVAGGRG